MFGPLASGALAAVGAGQTNEETAAWRVGGIADQPVASLAATVGEIVAASRLGTTRETVRQFGGLRRHGHLTPPSWPRCGQADAVASTRRGSSVRPRGSARTAAASRQ